MERITKRDLEGVCHRINCAVNGWAWDEVPEPWTRVNGENKATVGCYTLSGAYGGWTLHRIVTDGGGVQDVFGSGHMPKRELYDRMQAFLRGIEEIDPDTYYASRSNWRNA